MVERKFDPARLERLEDRERLETLPPERLWEMLGVQEDGTIVEVGAGTGLIAAEFLELAPRLSIVAVDVEQMMHDWMMEHRPEVAEGRLVPLLAEEVHIQLADASVDGVYTVSLHHELLEPEASYREALRITKPGGPILVVDWDARHMPKGPPLEIRASADEIAHALRAAGYVEVEHKEGLPYHTSTRAVRPEE
jgi:ubiquinone/menaquinone biosynthesis C-methylase UbiE